MNTLSKRLLIASIAGLSLLLMGGTVITADNDSPVFGLLITDDRSLDPACRHSNGKFEDVSIYPDSSEPHPEFILNKIKDFIIFKNGSKIGSFKVTKIEKGGLNCYGFLAGYGTSNVSDSALKLPGYYPMDYLPVLSSNSKAVKTQQRSAPLKVALSKIQEEKLMEIVKQKFQEQKVDSNHFKDIKIEISLSYDLDGDNIIEHFLQAKLDFLDTVRVEDGSLDSIPTIKVVAIWAKIDEDNVIPISIFDKKGNFTYGEDVCGLVDVLDIDGDSIPEVILQAYHEPEFEYFQIYRYTKNGFELVYFGAGSGC